MVGEILIDDTDFGIQYSGSWVLETNTQQNLGNNGRPFQNTLHRADGNASFSYTFRGSNFLVYGTIETAPLTPTWQCFLDGSSITPSLSLYTGTDNRIQFCDGNGLIEGSHSIVVNVTVSPGDPDFLFDYLHYIPFNDVSLDDTVVEVEVGVPDNHINFTTTGQWSHVFPGYMTTLQGSAFTFNFTGVSISWLGFYNNTFPMASTTATYSIDGRNPTSFSLDGSVGRNTNGQFRQIFFNSSQLPAGPHVLEVVYQGTVETTPLTVSSLIIQNGTNSLATMTATPTGVPSSNPELKSATPHRFSEIGLIVGCLLGALLILLLILWFRRRKVRDQARVYIPQPFGRPDTYNGEPPKMGSAGQDNVSTPPARETDSGIRFSPVRQFRGEVGATLPPAYTPPWSWQNGESTTGATGDSETLGQAVSNDPQHTQQSSIGTKAGMQSSLG